MRKKRIWLFLWITFVLFGVAAGLIRKEMKEEKSRIFAESDKSIANPDRGFYIQVQSSRPDKIPDIAKEVRIILLAFDIEGCTGEDLPADKLEELEIALHTAKQEHVAVIFRAAYGFCADVKEPEEIEYMGRHIEQMAEVLNDYQEEILVVQAGMLGAYGEWHSSRYLDGTEEEKRESRLYILRSWEAHLKEEIKVAVRRPRFIREAMAENILKGRLGIHNDALLSTESDMGTYDEPGMERADELAWSKEYLKGQVNGGEMPTPGAFNEPENANQEFAQLHISYLNLKYNEEILSRWSQMRLEGMEAKGYLENHLGYRVFVPEIDARRFYFSGELLRDGLQMRIHLCNTGYASVPERYRVFLTAGNGEEFICKEIEAAQLYQISNGESMTKELNIQIPEKLLEGGEAVVVGLKIAPDAYDADDRDCVELANPDFHYQEGVNEIALLTWKWNGVLEVTIL